MLSLRYSDVKTLVASVLSLCDDDSRVLSYVNRATQRLLFKGKWKGTILRYQVCVNAGCVTWPRQIETIEKAVICNTPVTVRNNWYEFLGAGPGMLAGAGIGVETFVDQGESCAFDDVRGTLKKLAVYCDREEDAGKYITLQFYSGGAQWVTSEFGGEVIDGEKIALTPAFATYVLTTNTCMARGLVRVIKDATVGPVRLYEYDTVALTYRPLGYYEADEQVPIYRRSLIPCLAGSCCSNLNVTADTPVSVTVMGKLRFIPVTKDTDFLVISHVDAIRLAAQAILKEENGKIEEAAAYFMMAIAALGDELKHHQGDGAVVPVQIQSQNSAAVLNMI